MAKEKQNKLETGKIEKVDGIDQVIFNVGENSIETCSYYGGDMMTIQSYTWDRNKDGSIGPLDKYKHFSFPEEKYMERVKILKEVDLEAKGKSPMQCTRLCSLV
jgi:hypothetical protein